MKRDFIAPIKLNGGEAASNKNLEQNFIT